MQIYQPAEDSYLLSKTLKKHLKDKPKSINILDMGSGSGIQAQTCKKQGFKNILTADINKDAIKHLKKQNLKIIHTNLFENIKKLNKNGDTEGAKPLAFNLIIFNPPYLPSHKYDKKQDTTGGKKGYETIISFLIQAKQHLLPKSEIILLFSSFSKPSIIKQKAKELGYKFKLLSKKKLFFEELYVYILTLR